jgi:hypothetical protein
MNNNLMMNNGMIVLPILTPYGTQLVPMPIDQLINNNSGNLANLAMLQSANMLGNQTMLPNSNSIQSQLNANAAAAAQLNALRTLNAAAANHAAANPTSASLTLENILKQQAINQATNQATEAAKAKASLQRKVSAQMLNTKTQSTSSGSSPSTSGKSSPNNLGTIGDLRPLFRSGNRSTTSGFSSGNNSESDSSGCGSHEATSVGQLVSMLKLSSQARGVLSSQARGVPLSNKIHSSTASSNSSGWSESAGSSDEGMNGQKTNKHIKLIEQRSQSKSLFLNKMVEVLDSYFSDDGLKKNQFLAKQLQMNVDGVPLKKVAGMRRVKALTRDLNTVASAIRRSPLLELNRDGSLVKRLNLPAQVQEAPKPIRSVLAINLFSDSPTVESVTSQFAQYGELTQVRVIRPGTTLPLYLREFTVWVPDLGKQHCAVIEFETQEEAQAACREINMANRAEGKLRVALLKPGARIRRTLYRKYKDEEIEEKENNNGNKNCNNLKSGQTKETGKKSVHVSSMEMKLNGSDSGLDTNDSNNDRVLAANFQKNTQKIDGGRRRLILTRPKNSKSVEVIRQPIGPNGGRGFSRHFYRNRALE